MPRSQAPDLRMKILWTCAMRSVHDSWYMSHRTVWVGEASIEYIKKKHFAVDHVNLESSRTTRRWYTLQTCQVTQSRDSTKICSFTRHVCVYVVLGTFISCSASSTTPLERSNAIPPSPMPLAISQPRIMPAVSSLGANVCTVSSELQRFPQLASLG